MVGGTGTGTCTAITLGKLAEFGTYKVINRVVVAEGGDFEVLSPSGASVGRFLMGTLSTAAAAFTSDHVNFTLTDATDFIADRSRSRVSQGRGPNRRVKSCKVIDHAERSRCFQSCIWLK